MNNADLEAARLIEQHGGLTAASKASGIPRGTLWARAKRVPAFRGNFSEGGSATGGSAEGVLAAGGDSAPPWAAGMGDGDISASSGEQHADIVYVACEPITVDDVLARSGHDLAVWQPVSTEAKSWQAMAKDGDGRVTVTRMHGCRVRCKRMVSTALADAVSRLAGKLAKGAGPPKQKQSERKRTKPNARMAELLLSDAHYGKMAWAPESGEHYDLKIASRVFTGVAEEAIIRLEGVDIEEVVMPIGNDFLHIDTPQNTTTAGTPQDVDGRLSKIIEVALEDLIWTVERLRSLSRGLVYIPFVPGNHDHHMSLMIAKMLEQRYHDEGSVVIDATPAPRKYHVWKKCGIGFTHGDGEKPEALPQIMDQEMAEKFGVSWQDVPHREWHVGHHHRRRRYGMGLQDDEYAGVPVRTVEAICGTDRWHNQKGYVRSRRGGRVFIWHPDDGLESTMFIPVR